MILKAAKKSYLYLGYINKSREFDGRDKFVFRLKLSVLCGFIDWFLNYQTSIWFKNATDLSQRISRVKVWTWLYQTRNGCVKWRILVWCWNQKRKFDEIWLCNSTQATLSYRGSICDKSVLMLIIVYICFTKNQSLSWYNETL